MTAAYPLGVHFGTNSVRAIVVDCRDGRMVSTRVCNYPSGDQGVLLDPRDPHVARPDPADDREGLRASVGGALAVAVRDADFSVGRVIGIGVDTTGSTDELYGIHRELHGVFGGVPGSAADLGAAMKRRLAIRNRVTAR